MRIGEGADAVVAAYLKAHPQFFVEHPAVLAEIAVPHVTGEAVSLVERQVAALREQYRRLENKYRELLTIAAENDDLRRRLHQLTIKLLGSDDIKATIATLYQALMEDFRADFVALKVFAAPRPVNGELVPEFLGREAAERNVFAALIAGMHPLCGGLEALAARCLVRRRAGRERFRRSAAARAPPVERRARRWQLRSAPLRFRHGGRFSRSACRGGEPDHRSLDSGLIRGPWQRIDGVSRSWRF